MSAFHLGQATQRVVPAAFLATVAVVLMASVTPVLAFTCDDVRALTHAEQTYWSKQLNLTVDQRHRIWVECYGPAAPARVIEANGESFQPLTAER